MGCGDSKPMQVPTTQIPLRNEVHMLDSPPPSAPGDSPAISFAANLGTYGTHKFRGKEAAKYLAKQKLAENVLDTAWTRDAATADKVAAAVLEWCRDHGAMMYTHCFQPLGSGMMRLGQMGQVHNAMFNFDRKTGGIKYEFDGDILLHGETDGSSYLNGGMRKTHTAGGYTALDPTCPMFIRGDTVFIPTVFVSWHGQALDEKTPLLRSMKAISTEGKRLMKNLGWEVSGVQPNIGLEQEFFLIPREAYYKRPDLQFSGRTIMGRCPPRGQELCDHYMSPLNQVALKCLQEIQHEAFLMGIPLKTRHREVAPNQYECAPYFGIASNQIDENLVVMQLIEEIATKHGLVGLLHEKPFLGINGSGKHNNFSLGTPEGINLFNGPQVTKAGGADVFPIIMAAVVRAVDMHGDLLRMSIASPGNDFRLGACEAPPAIISTYLGDQLTQFLKEFKEGQTGRTYDPSKKTIDVGVDGVAPFQVPAEDRNRTSPFPYGGHRFEYRAAGSSQNVSMINTVLCTIIADSFAAFSAEIEGGKKATDVAGAALDAHWKCIFNGDGYSEEWPKEAGKLGVWRIDSGIDAMARLTAEKNIELFKTFGVLTEEETTARADVMFEHYVGIVEIEAKCMVDMIQQYVVPDCKKAGLSVASEIENCIPKLTTAIEGMMGASSTLEKAKLARVLRLEMMEDIRKKCDEAEGKVPPGLWTLGTYKELLFLDSHQGQSA